MSRKTWLFDEAMLRLAGGARLMLLAGIVLTLAACGGGGETGEAESQAQTGTKAEPATGVETQSKAVADAGSGERPSPFGPNETHRSNHDPNAVYTLDDLTMEGSYLKLDFRDLTDEQVNRIVHRLKSELSTCGSGLTIDECLVNRPSCSTAVYLGKQVIREAKITHPKKEG